MRARTSTQKTSGIRTDTREAKNEWIAVPNEALFMAFFVHVDLLRCPSLVPVPVPVPEPPLPTTKTTFMNFRFLTWYCCCWRWRPCPLPNALNKSNWNEWTKICNKYEIAMKGDPVRSGFFIFILFLLVLFGPFMCGDNRFYCQCSDVEAHHRHHVQERKFHRR